MKQPHEDVVGVDRSGDDLLSLDERAVAHRLAIAALTKHLLNAVWVGNPCPDVARMSARMKQPQVGDLVFEWMVGLSRRRDLDDHIKALGYLVEKRLEWWTTDEEWERYLAEELAGRREHDPTAELDAEDLERSTDEAWYVQYGPDPKDICRWVNCVFVVVPIDPAEFSRSVGTQNADGSVTVTRDLPARQPRRHGLRAKPRRLVMSLRDWLEVVACVLAILVAAWWVTRVVASRLEAMADDTTDDAEIPAAPTETVYHIGEEPCTEEEFRAHVEQVAAEPAPTLREERIYWVPEDGRPEVDLTPYVVPGTFVQLATANPVDDGSAVKVGNTWVHRSCANARRDNQPRRVCEYCAPRLAGIPTTGGNRP